MPARQQRRSASTKWNRTAERRATGANPTTPVRGPRTWRALGSRATAAHMPLYALPSVVVPAGGYLMLEEADFVFGLGAADSARLFRPDGTLADSYTWSAH